MGDSDIESIVLSCNKLAMDHLKEEKFASALHLLNRAKDLLDFPSASTKLLAVTLNNLGCFYKKKGKLALSLQYLTRALHLEQLNPSDKVNQAGTHLNITAIRSSMNQHKLALNHATEAINMLLEAEALDTELNIKTTLAIAYHNAGIEYEFLGNSTKAAEMFNFGLKLAEKYLL